MPYKKLEKVNSVDNRSTKIVSFVNKKGGTGKTVSCMHVAAVLADYGTVVGIDIDPEASWYYLWDREGGEQILGYEVILGGIIQSEGGGYQQLIEDVQRLERQGYEPSEAIEMLKKKDYTQECIVSLKELIKDVKKEHKPNYIIIDTPANSEMASYAAAMVSDIVIIPQAPTAHDADRLANIGATILDVEKIRKKEISYILLTKCNERLNITKQILYEAQRDGFPILESKISNLVAYQEIAPSYLEEYEEVLTEIGVI